MANCNECIKINSIPECADTWEVGTVDTGYAGSPLKWRLTDIATARIYSGDTENIGAGGEVTITLPDELLEMMGHIYELQLFETDSTEPIQITIGTTSKCCVTISTVPTSGTTVTFSTTTCVIP